LICDPYYRTFAGFKALVHKEWLYYLYNFQKKGYVLEPEPPKIETKISDNTGDEGFLT